jgi:hypothetical protein
MTYLHGPIIRLALSPVGNRIRVRPEDRAKIKSSGKCLVERLATAISSRHPESEDNGISVSGG